MKYDKEQIKVLKEYAEKVIAGKEEYEQKNAGGIIVSLCEQLEKGEGKGEKMGPVEEFVKRVKSEEDLELFKEILEYFSECLCDTLLSKIKWVKGEEEEEEK